MCMSDCSGGAARLGKNQDGIVCDDGIYGEPAHLGDGSGVADADGRVMGDASPTKVASVC